MLPSKPKIVVVGGGTGTYTLLRGLRQFHTDVAITAIVTMADSGGSTGRLRDEFGQLPVGDARQALAALAPDIPGAPNLLRDLFLYRFTNGQGLVGHNFGNLFLTALTDMLGTEARAIEAAADLLQVCGQVLPVTTEATNLQAQYQSGRIVIGEHEIDEPLPEYTLDRIVDLSLTPSVALANEAKTALVEADYIIFGPGDFYTSIMANIVVSGFREAVSASSATLVFVANLMARPGQTIGMNLTDYLHEFEHYLARKPQIVIVPDQPLSAELVLYYAEKEAVHPVEYTEDAHITVIKAPIVSTTIVEPVRGDVLQRSFIRHDSQALANSVMSLLHR